MPFSLFLKLFHCGRGGENSENSADWCQADHRHCYDFSRRFKSSMSDEPRRMQVLDLYCLARFESEVQVEESQLKTS